MGSSALELTTIAVIGSRNFKKLDMIQDRFVSLVGSIETYEPVTIISGGAQGVDREAIKVAERCGFKTVEFTPDMSKGYDVREYHRRNDKIIDAADWIIAFWDGESRGTESVIQKALAKRKRVEVIFD